MAVCLVSCETINYDGETRLVIEGNLRDDNGSPLPNQQMEIVVQKRNYSNAITDKDQISYGASDVDGKFQFVIPEPKGDNDFVDINVYINGSTSTYQFKGVRGIRKSNFSNYRYQLNDLVLYKNAAISNLTIQLNQLNSSNELTALDISGIRADTYLDINPLPDDNDTVGFGYETLFRVAKNQTVTLLYTVTNYSNPNNPVATNYSQPIVINADNTVTYLLTY